MKKRANLLVSLIHSPKLLILDEPTFGLDPLLRKTIWGYIHKINQKGTTILVTSHLLDEISKHCNDISILNKGVINYNISIDNYKNKYHTYPLGELFEKFLQDENF